LVVFDCFWVIRKVVIVGFCAEFDFLQNSTITTSGVALTFRFMFFASSQLLVRANYLDRRLSQRDPSQEYLHLEVTPSLLDWYYSIPRPFRRFEEVVGPRRTPNDLARHQTTSPDAQQVQKQTNSTPDAPKVQNNNNKTRIRRLMHLPGRGGLGGEKNR
jgi:hypothetical protein